MSYPEKRRHPRYDTTNVAGSLVFSLEADIKNISIAGMAVETRSQFTVGQRYTVALGRAQQSLELVATAKWCQLERTERSAEGDQLPVYTAGFAFEEVLSEKALNLLHFLEENVILDFEERLFGRLRPYRSERVSLASEYPFEVRRLSLSGMLIETTVVADADSVFLMRVSLGGEEFVSRGRIANVKRPEVGQDRRVHYQLGVEFLEPEPEQAERLKTFIRRELESRQAP